MPITAAPRSVSDATRFTPTTPHASSKVSAASRFTSPNSNSSSGGGAPPPSGGGDGGSRFTETPEQRVARLRAAHRRAREAEVSKFDKIVAGGRRFFDSAHKITVLGLIGFTVVAGLVTVYTAADMIVYNKKRKAEFIEAQKKMEADSLEAARLAYMTNKATDEQIALVEEANAREAGKAVPIFKMPTVLGAPSPIDKSTEATEEKPQGRILDQVAAANANATAAETTQANKKGGSGLWSWMTGTLKKEEEGDNPETAKKGRLGWESLSEEDDTAGLRNSDLVRAVEEKQAYIKEKAHAAFEKERENQRKGGPLDKVGGFAGEETTTPAQEQPKRKGWLW
ncbi:cytochrome oxidase c assembly-domain-containing protein [Diplogelasinospora grovesii]|uniref:Cytochrome oxidase c assembly-domain-containing protein n=1 Tax=Diplogelasinospora grovesii TaxID=303347 RepID=A0AAN6NC07_9PEZI|nr:cytochrome oxidase c assembly-domain-containing protein [Diplogelasinospora grovesii]